MDKKLVVNNWNKVSECGLPPDNEWCFILIENYDGSVDWLVAGYDQGQHCFYVNFGLGGLVTDESSVVAWCLFKDCTLQ